MVMNAKSKVFFFVRHSISNSNSKASKQKTNCVFSHKFQMQFCLSIATALNKDRIVSIDDDDKTQYHEVNFNTSESTLEPLIYRAISANSNSERT